MALVYYANLCVDIFGKLKQSEVTRTSRYDKITHLGLGAMIAGPMENDLS